MGMKVVRILDKCDMTEDGNCINKGKVDESYMLDCFSCKVYNENKDKLDKLEMVPEILFNFIKKEGDIITLNISRVKSLKV